MACAAAAGLHPRVVAAVLLAYGVEDGQLTYIRQRRRLLPLTRAGARRAAVTVGELLTDEAADALAAILVAVALAAAHRAAPRADEGDRLVARVAEENDSWLSWDDRARGAARTAA